MWLCRTTWRKIGVIAAVLCMLLIIFELFYQSWVNDTPWLMQEEIDDCKLGRTTPEELGYPDLTCDELEVIEPWWNPIYFVTCYLSMIALGISIFAKEKISVELLNKHSEFVDKELVENVKKLTFPNSERVDHMDFEELQKWCYHFGIQDTTELGMRKSLKKKLNMKKSKQTPLGEIEIDFLLACNIEGHGEYEHVFHMKDLPPKELQMKLGSMCGYVHGNGKKCGGKFVNRIKFEQRIK